MYGKYVFFRASLDRTRTFYIIWRVDCTWTSEFHACQWSNAGLPLMVASAFWGPRNLHLHFMVKYYSKIKTCIAYNLPFLIVYIDIFFNIGFILHWYWFYSEKYKTSQFKNILSPQESYTTALVTRDNRIMWHNLQIRNMFTLQCITLEHCSATHTSYRYTRVLVWRGRFRYLNSYNWD